MTHDPRQLPQPGDVVSASGAVREVVHVAASGIIGYFATTAAGTSPAPVFRTCKLSDWRSWASTAGVER